MMEFRLLGAVHVVSGGRQARTGSGRARNLLASLAWQPQELVTDAQLIEQTWGERLPVDPTDALYTCAKRLRRALTAAGADGDRLVVRLRGGYLLDVAPDDIDLHRFRRLVREARSASDRISAAHLYERALRLSVGTPLADVDSPWALRARVTLSREQLSARVAAARAWLDAGRREEVVPDLVALADEHPLDEAVTGLLLEALSESGHLAEALDRYTLFRRQLVDQLGVEPGPELRATHQGLLDGVARRYGDATAVSGARPVLKATA